ncbi:MAG: site-specific DNA-methyltransferase, partial [Chloroflexi bacterium]|nr:site-specific DNA-methyltransferase [Chloroflexota bacterium]
MLVGQLEDEASEAAGKPHDEHFGLFWPGKRAARREAASPAKAGLHPAPGEGVDEANTRNLYLEGDNLSVLKLLRKAYSGRVKMIYIDPPYNTGNDFVYKDNFAESSDTYLRRSGQADASGQRLVSNPKAGGRFHSNWLNMIYPRLLLARELLRDDGVIFVSIDDNEVHHLRMVMDEIFGAENFVAELPWQSRLSKQNDTDISTNHEYILGYAKLRRISNRRLKESNLHTWHSENSFAILPLPL